MRPRGFGATALIYGSILLLVFSPAIGFCVLVSNGLSEEMRWLGPLMFLCILLPLILIAALVSGRMLSALTREYKHMNAEYFRANLVDTLHEVGYTVRETSPLPTESQLPPDTGTLVFGMRLGRVIAEIMPATARITGPRSVINQLKLPPFRALSGAKVTSAAIEQGVVSADQTFTLVLLAPAR